MIHTKWENAKKTIASVSRECDYLGVKKQDSDCNNYKLNLYKRPSIKRLLLKCITFKSYTLKSRYFI